MSLDLQRERLFNELAEEFSTFDRLGNLVRRVRTRNSRGLTFWSKREC